MKTKAMLAKERAADLRLKREFHISLAERTLIFEYQGKKCAMCKTPAVAGRNSLAVDHDHRTGLVRGLLCMRHNRALGKFHDDDDSVRAAAEYVTNPPATAALGRSHFTAPHRVGTAVRAKCLAKMQAETKSKRGA